MKIAHLSHLVLAALLVAIGASQASAHFLWVNIDPKTGDNGTVNVYFEHGAGPGDGGYLDPFAKAGKTWIRTPDSPEPELLATAEVTKPGKRWLSASLPKKGPRSIDSYGKFGVYRYGKTDVLLHYYARFLDVSSHDELHDLARAKQLDHDLVIHNDGDVVEVTVLWKGKPVADRTVHLLGPKKLNKKLKTNDEGVASFTAEAPGRYYLRSSVEEDTPGKDDGNDYSLIRHQCTLIVTLPLAD